MLYKHVLLPWCCAVILLCPKILLHNLVFHLHEHYLAEIYPPRFEVFPSIHCVPVVYLWPVLCIQLFGALPNYVSCRRQGMLTQGPTLDPKCKFNISSFLTLPHSSDCLTCTKNSMPIVLLLQMMSGWGRWGWLIYNRVWVLSCSFCLVFSLLLFPFFLSCPLSLFEVTRAW